MNRFETSSKREVDVRASAGMHLREEVVPVWIVPLSIEPRTRVQETSVLSRAEIDRAERFIFEKDRLAYVHSHVALRCILGGYLNTDPSSLRFSETARGKPYLAGAHASSGLYFSLSHTHGLALCALAFGREVGVDAEAMDRAIDVQAVARRTYSPDEQNALLGLTGAEQRAAFFRIWTRKEAFVKACGGGLDEHTGDFTVSCADGHGDALLSSVQRTAATSWRIQAVQCPPGYYGAVAAAGRDWSVETQTWERSPA